MGRGRTFACHFEVCGGNHEDQCLKLMCRGIHLADEVDHHVQIRQLCIGLLVREKLIVLQENHFNFKKTNSITLNVILLQYFNLIIS